MKKINDADMLAAIVRASNHYAMRPALVLDNQTYTIRSCSDWHGAFVKH